LHRKRTGGNQTTRHSGVGDSRVFVKQISQKAQITFELEYIFKKSPQKLKAPQTGGTRTGSSSASRGPVTVVVLSAPTEKWRIG
jgi:hypothetical protein